MDKDSLIIFIFSLLASSSEIRGEAWVLNFKIRENTLRTTEELESSTLESKGGCANQPNQGIVGNFK